MMLKNMALGMYYPGKSLLHRLQARTKLLALIWTAVWLMIATSRVWHFIPYIVAVTFFCIAVACSGISPRQMWQRMWFLLLLVFIGGIQNLSSKEVDEKIFSTLGPWLTSYGSVQAVLLVVSIVMAMLLLLSLLPSLPILRQQRWLKRLKIPLLFATIAAVVFFWLITATPASQPFAF